MSGTTSVAAATAADATAEVASLSTDGKLRDRRLGIVITRHVIVIMDKMSVLDRTESTESYTNLVRTYKIY